METNPKDFQEIRLYNLTESLDTTMETVDSQELHFISQLVSLKSEPEIALSCSAGQPAS